MTHPTVDDLRSLAKRSRRTHKWGVVALTGALALVPLEMALRPLLPWSAFASLGAGGLLLLRFAYVAGEERGAYRRLFREIKAAQLTG